MNNYQTFNKLKTDLSEYDIDQILYIVGHRCRIKTYSKLRSALTYGASRIQNCGILNRLIKDKDGWTYIAGQSYSDEIRTLREVILGDI